MNRSITILHVMIGFVLIVKGNSQLGFLEYLGCEFYDLIYPIFGGESHYLNYYLFSKNNSVDACDLQPTEEALKRCKFNPKIKTKVIIHGWVNKLLKSSPIFDLKDKLLQVGNYNVVVFNWTAYTNTFNYTNGYITNYRIAGLYSFYVGLQVSSWIHFLEDLGGADLKDFHLISHSLGAEVSSYAAKTLCHLGHITFLDAAAPTFRHLPEFLQPSYTDADFVDSIHTSGAITNETGYGYLRPIADIDYYPNGGQMQPKCYPGATYKDESGNIDTVKSTTIYCNHDASITYYIASLNETCEFLGLICDSYEDYESGKCSRENAPGCRMGFFSIQLPGLPPHSKCYLNTSKNPPYCLN